MVPSLDSCLLALFGWYRLCSQYFPYTVADRMSPCSPQKIPRYIHVFNPNDADWGGFNQGVALLNAIRRCSCCLSPSLSHRGSHPCINTPASVCACARMWIHVCVFAFVAVSRLSSPNTASQLFSSTWQLKKLQQVLSVDLHWLYVRGCYLNNAYKYTLTIC